MGANTLIFDLDGTLVDSCAICVAILSDMLADRGSDHVICPVAARPWMSVGGAKMVAALLGPACGDPVEEIAEFRRRYAVKETSPDTLFADVAQGLARLKADGHKLAICSNKPQNLVDNVLRDTGLAPLFTSVVGSRPDVKPKPAPDLLDLVLAQTGAAPRDCLFIGDSEIDHEVAEKAGMPFLFLTHGYAHADYRPDPESSYHSFADLIESILARQYA
ncbi:HAD family hydrolase [Novosphingobium umbonatum]|nr:HAD-IA family hydrolase [Novosphingobium umbonatum]